MDNYKTFITDSLMNFDKNMKEQKKLFKNITTVEIVVIDNDIENDKLIFYDNNNVKILEADYEIISTYDADHSLWIWGWGDASMRTKWIRTITKILNYGISLDQTKNLHLKLELINSRFIISDPIQIDIHLSIASSLSKIENIFPLAISKKEEIDEKYVKFPVLKEYNDDVKIYYFFLYNIKKFT